MKKLEIALNGHRIYYPDDLTHLNEAIQESAAALAKMFGDSWFLTDTTVVVNGANYECDAGWMYYKGELCQFDAQSVPTVVGETSVWVPVETYRIDPVLYADSSNQKPHVIRKVEITTADLGISQPADYVATADMKTLQQAIAETMEPAWIQVGNSGTALAVGTSALATDAPYVRYNNYTKLFEAKGGFQRGAGMNAGAVYTLCTLPVAMRPAQTVYGTAVIFCGDFTSFAHPVPIELLATGELSFYMIDEDNPFADAVIRCHGLRMYFP